MRPSTASTRTLGTSRGGETVLVALVLFVACGAAIRLVHTATALIPAAVVIVLVALAASYALTRAAARRQGLRAIPVRRSHFG